MNAHVYLAQYLCPKRHCILMVAEESDLGRLEALRNKLLGQLLNLKFDGLKEKCGLCGAPFSACTVEVARTRFKTMRAARPELMVLHDQQMATRAYFKAGKN